MTEFSDLVPDPGERTLVYGGTRTGKSSYQDWVIRNIQEVRPDAMILLMDTKPRFRAEFVPYGPNNRWRREASKLYENWTKGPLLPNSASLRLNQENPFAGMWKRPGEVAIMQSGQPQYRRWMLYLARRFMEMNVKGREKLIVVDEGLDFYLRNSLGVDSRNDVILDSARAGGERNVGLVFCAHRPYGIPPLLNTLSSRVVLFHLRFKGDMKYLWDMGIPEGEFPPEGDYKFNQYKIQPGGTVSPAQTVRLVYPEWYLRQLAST